MRHNFLLVALLALFGLGGLAALNASDVTLEHSRSMMDRCDCCMPCCGNCEG